MIKVSYELSDELKQFLASKGVRSQYIRTTFRRNLRSIQQEARAKHGFTTRTGQLERSIDTKITSEDPLIGEVYINEAMAPYGAFVHEGTGIYGPNKKGWFVKPVEKKALRFVKEGQFFFSKGHKMDGQKEDKFLDKAFKSKFESVRRSMEKAVLKEIQGGT